MQKTKALFGEEARAALKRGMDAVARPVISSMGAQGRNTAFQGPMGAEVTNDGVTIARLITPDDDFEAVGAEMLKQAAEQTNLEAGDGTSTSIALAHAIMTEGMLVTGSPMEIRRQLNSDKEVLVEKLREMSVPCETEEQLMDVARISVEDEAIAKTVVESVLKAGTYGAVIVDEGVGYSIEKEEVQGYSWDKGYISPYMVNTMRGEAVLNDAAVLLTDRSMNTNRELIGFITELHGSGVKSLLIIADNIEGELLQTLILNSQNARLTTVVVKRPGTIEELEDIALLTGAIAVTKDKGIKDILKAHAGFVSRVVVSRDKTVLIGEKSTGVENRIQELAAEIENDKDNDLLKRRMGMLADGMVHLRIGAKTETERSYLKRKVDDAVLACIAAKEEGIVPGGGTTLAALAEFAESPILKKALGAPRSAILNNADINDNGKDYNVRTGEVVKNHFKEGIIDPTKVVRCEIENAISLAGTFLTVENVVVVIPESQQGLQN